MYVFCYFLFVIKIQKLADNQHSKKFLLNTQAGEETETKQLTLEKVKQTTAATLINASRYCLKSSTDILTHADIQFDVGTPTPSFAMRKHTHLLSQ